MKRGSAEMDGTGSNALSNDQSVAPMCLRKLVRKVVRGFYSREHSLIIDLLVRNTIMKEDDLCERLHFEKKQLRQHLHTLKQDQFIKSKLKLETDADDKIAKIVHYFIDYKLFVNVVKYRLDQMQRRLENEQRQTSSRSVYTCTLCKNSYTDLEIDRLIDMETGNLVCVYCQHEVKEEEDNEQRSDARALVVKFHSQVRGPLDELLKECDQVHLSSSILEPEFRSLEPLPGSQADASGVDPRAVDSWLNDSSAKNASGGDASVKVAIVLDAPTANTSNAAQVPKERPIWMSESTVVNGAKHYEPFKTDTETVKALAPGRVPSSLHDTVTSEGGAQQSAAASAALESEIMQMLQVHERRGLGNHGPKSALNKPQPPPVSKSLSNGKGLSNPFDPLVQDGLVNTKRILPANYLVKCGTLELPVYEVTADIVRKMTEAERREYAEVAMRLYADAVVD